MLQVRIRSAGRQAGRRVKMTPPSAQTESAVNKALQVQAARVQSSPYELFQSSAGERRTTEQAPGNEVLLKFYDRKVRQ